MSSLKIIYPFQQFDKKAREKIILVVLCDYVENSLSQIMLGLRSNGKKKRYKKALGKTTFQMEFLE